MRDFRLNEKFADAPNQWDIFDDFGWYISPHFWTSLSADVGVTAPVGSDTRDGIVTMATAATDNNEVAVRSTNELFIFRADASFIYEVKLQFTEANTDDANVAMGLADAAGANLLSDDGGGDNINSSGVLIFKVDGGTVWRCACENNGTIVETASEQTAGGASYQRLRIIGRPVSGTDYEFSYFLNNLPLTDATYHRPIQHTLAYASATEMRLVAGYLKAGGANEETLNIDYAAFNGVRTL